MTDATTVPDEQKQKKPPSRFRTAMSGTAGITFLSIVMALVIGAFFIAFSDPAVQEAAQQHLGLGVADPLAHYILAKA